MTFSPYISVVIGARNDDHGGNFLSRLQLSISLLHHHFHDFAAGAEIIIIEWNPPPERPALAEALKWHVSKNIRIRVITVPNTLHKKIGGESPLPFHQMIAKNVGIRRAQGKYVLVTNADILLSEPVAQLIRDQALTQRALFRVDRYDVPSNTPLGKHPTELLSHCGHVAFRRHSANGTVSVKSSFFQIFLLAMRRSPLVLALFSMSAPITFPLFLVVNVINNIGRSKIKSTAWLRYRHAICQAKKYSRFYRLCGVAHTNASGDFTLMAKDDWMSVGGYPEWPIHPIHLDGALCYKALFKGIKEIFLAAPYKIFHIEHEGTTGYQNYGDASYWENQSNRGIKRLTDDDYLKIVEDLFLGRSGASLTQQDWGLAKQQLSEQIISKAPD